MSGKSPFYTFYKGGERGFCANERGGWGVYPRWGKNMDKGIIRGRGFVRVAGKRDGRPIFTGL